MLVYCKDKFKGFCDLFLFDFVFTLHVALKSSFCTKCNFHYNTALPELLLESNEIIYVKVLYKIHSAIKCFCPLNKTWPEIHLKGFILCFHTESEL